MEFEHTWSNLSSEILSILSHSSRGYIVDNSQNMGTRTERKLVNGVECYITCNEQENDQKFRRSYDSSTVLWEEVLWLSGHV